MKREAWMKRGTKVSALERNGTIMHCYDSEGWYVHKISVRCEDGKRRLYHPTDVKPK